MNANQYRMAALHRRRFLQGGVGLAASSTAVWLLACGGSSKEEAKSTVTGGAAQGTTAAGAATKTPKPGGRLLQAYTSSTTSLNPITDSGQRLSLGALHLWDRLVSPRINKDYVLEAAQSVELPDPTTVVFKLKPGLKFQDRAPANGRAVDTEDIVKSQLYVRDEPRGAGNNAFQRNSMESVEASDSQTVVFKLKGPNAYLFSGTQFGDPGAQCIFAREQVGNLDTGWSVGSGPYEMVEYEMNVRYLYRRFAGFRDAAKGQPYIDEREWRVIQDTAAQEAAFRSEQLHLWQLPVTSLLDPIKRDMSGKIEIDEWLALSMQTVSANATKPPFNDVRVREGLYRVVNRQQYLDLIQEGKGKVPPGPMPVGLTDYQLTEAQTEKYFRQDAKAAKQLLDAAGFPYDKEIEITAINRPQDTQGCEILAQQLSTVGVKTRIVPLGTAEFLQGRMATGNWETFVAYWPGYDTPQFPLRMHHTDSQPPVHKYHGLKDPVIDKMIEKSEVTLDKNERIKLVKDIQIALLEKYTPVIYTQNNTTYQPRWKYVRDYEINPASHPMYRTEMWMDR